tara:strand:+ start:219 stop:377 length:159 start_codon:yes stop_codon:yes gene_type:complete
MRENYPVFFVMRALFKKPDNNPKRQKRRNKENKPNDEFSCVFQFMNSIDEIV